MPNKFSADKQSGARGARGGKSRSRAPARSIGQALDALLQRQPLLAARAAQASENTNLIEAVRTLLPPELAAHALAASQQGTDLWVTADAAVWSGRLRYPLSAALPALQQQWPGITRIRLKVGPG